MGLGWREYLRFELAYVGSQRLAETTFAVRLDLGARRRLQILVQLHDLLARQRQPHHALADPRDLLRRHIARLSERSRRDRQPIKDVLGVVPSNLVDLADLAAISGNYLPASPDHQPRNRISHLDSLTARAQQRWLEPCPQLGPAVRSKEKGERVALPPNRD